jgi:NAD(P)-dependent dehydrogenase (short-subunit alcohol dehydrogenase family)
MVTGAAGLLGSAVARQLARAGDHLALVDSDETRVGQLARELGDELAMAAHTDVADAAQVDNAVARSIQRWGRVDAVVHAAGGLLGTIAPILDYPTEAWRSSLDINLTGTFNMVRAAGRAMRDQGGGGHIALVGSGSSLRPSVASVGYSASKAGMIGIMRAAAVDLAEYGIQVNLVLPGSTPPHPIDWDSPDRGVNLEPNVLAAFSSYRDTTLLRRLGSPEEFGKCVADLLGWKNISGQIVNFDSKLV